MRPWSAELSGTLETIEIESRALRGNALGDPATRPLLVYLPPEYAAEPARRFPVVYVLQGFSGFVTTWTSRRAFELSVPELLDREMSTPETPPVLIVYVDAWTRLGGSQFVDSPGTGNYHTYLCEEVVAFVDSHYRTLADRDHRAVSGKSSGGYGALVSAMWRPDVFGALASHSGDAAFELSLLPEIAAAHRALRDRYGGSLEAFVAEIASVPENGARPDPGLTIVYAYARCFTPGEDGSGELPFSVSTGALREEVFAQWLGYDPVRMVRAHSEALASLHGIYLDAGRSDEYHLDTAAEILAAAIREAGIEVRLELFEGSHRMTEWRYPIGLRFLAGRISD